MTDMIALAGDWHAELGWAKACVRKLRELGVRTVLHVGDFGVGFSNHKEYVERLEYFLARAGMTIYVTPGNHENYDLIDGLPTLDQVDPARFGMPEGKLLRLSEHILLMPRGYRWQVEDRSFVSLGGANSIDKSTRTPHFGWWPQESITLGDVMRTTAAGPADVMIAHAAPNAAKYELSSEGWDPGMITYSNESRAMLDEVVAVVQPKLFVHGHYHIDKAQYVEQVTPDGERFATQYLSLGMNGERNNLALLDPTTLQVRLIGWPYA